MLSGVPKLIGSYKNMLSRPKQSSHQRHSTANLTQKFKLFQFMLFTYCQTKMQINFDRLVLKFVDVITIITTEW